MTTSDMWIINLSRGGRLGQHGGLISSASYVAWTLLEYIKAGKVDARYDITDIDTVISGEMLIELLRETERAYETTLTESDGRRSIDCVDAGDTYRVQFTEF